MNVVGRALIRSAGARSFARPSIQHTTVLTSLVRFATTSSSSSKLGKLLETLKSSKDLSVIRDTCSALVVEVNQKNVEPAIPPSSIDTEQFTPVFYQLAVSGLSEDWECLEEILRDLCPRLGIQPSNDLYSSILLRLAQDGHLDQAQQLLLKMPQLPGKFTPDLTQFHLVLESGEGFTEKQLQDFPSIIQKLGQQPSAHTFNLLFQSHWKSSAKRGHIPSVDGIASLIRSYRQHGLTFEPAIVRTLFQNYADIGQFEQAEDIALMYESILKASYVEYEDPIAENPEDAAVEDATQPTVNTSQADRAAMARLRSARTYADIKRTQEAVGIACTIVHYTVVLNNAARVRKLDEALLIYEKSKEAGITPDAIFVNPLFRLLGREGTEGSIDKGIEIYQHLVDSNPTRGPDITTYKSVIHMLLSSPNSKKHLPYINHILDEMYNRGLPMNTSLVAEANIISEMRRRGNFSDAKEVYREYRKHLSERGFFEILREYCRISFAGDLEVPLITEYFSIVNDMRLQRVSVTPQVYGVILHNIGYIATKLAKSNMHDGYSMRVYDRLVATVRRVHDFLTLDASISPDEFLWNQLMDAYQRLGLFGDACRLWDMMYLTGRFNQISVTIILDACGYAKHTQKAASILAKLARSGFVIDLRNWNTWVECLCRSGRFKEALDVVCEGMPGKNVQPDIASIEILSKFARKNNISPEFLVRIQQTLPSLWNRLPKEIREPW